MSKVMIAPGRYVQGAGAIEEIGEHLKGHGTNALVLGGRKGLNSVRGAMEASLDLAGSRRGSSRSAENVAGAK